MFKNLRRKKLQYIIFRGVLFVNILVFLVAFLIIGLFTYKNIITTIGESRVNLLKQASERSKIINNSAVSIAKDIYYNFAYKLITNTEKINSETTKEIEQISYKNDNFMKELGIDLSTIIIMRNGYEYYSSNESQESITDIKRSYWYLENFFNDKNEIWVMRFDNQNSNVKMKLSYGKILRNSNRKYMGIILISAQEKNVYNTYSDIISDKNVVYILNEEGEVISHTNKNIIGNHLYYMKSFFDEYEKNSFTITYKGGKQIFLTNYYDELTKWTIVEEIEYSTLIKPYESLVNTGILILIFLIFINFAISYYISRSISEPLVKLTDKLLSASSANFETIKVQEDYYEVKVMSKVFNRMMAKIEELIDKIKSEEKIKRKIELDFLQSQINPHFLYNTLFSVKCLIDMGKYPKAEKLLSNLMVMLKIPINSDEPLIELSEEINNLKSYVSMMNLRYDNEIDLHVDIEEDLMEGLVPRMILQPIVENSIFHGFKDNSKNGMVSIIGTEVDDKLILRVRDNGLGMSQEDITNLWESDENKKILFNKIGLKNIKERINVIYGSECDINILSEYGEGTEVILTLRKLTREGYYENSSNS